MKFSQKLLCIALITLSASQLSAALIINNSGYKVLVDAFRLPPGERQVKRGISTENYIESGQQKSIDNLFVAEVSFYISPAGKSKNIASYACEQIDDASTITINPDNTVTVTLPEN